MIKICDMTSRSYFGKMNSTLGSVVPLAMFEISILVAGIAHAMALGLGPWMAVEIPDLIDKVTMVTKYFLKSHSS